MLRPGGGMRQWFNEEQIIANLQEVEGPSSKAEIRCKHGITEATFYRWQEQ